MISGEHFADTSGRTTLSYDFKYKYFSTTGYFIKAGLERKIFEGELWKIFIPYGFSYLNQITKYHIEGWYSGCFNWGTYNDMIQTTNRSLNIYFGLGVQYQNCDHKFSGIFNLNKAFTSLPLKNFFPNYINRYVGNPLYFSGQINYLVKLSKDIWLGPSCEVFFYQFETIEGLINKIKGTGGYYGEFQSVIGGVNNKNIWINPGLRLQIDL